MLPDNFNCIAYLCAEFGIDSDLPTYAGGLGILTADAISAAADINFPLIGIGILYKGKDFIQNINARGEEEKRDSQFDHDTSFLRQTSKDGKPLVIKIPFESYEVLIKPYQIRLADKTILYFLSTDVDGNGAQWRADMDALYRGDMDSLIRQQILLGVGGVKLLNELSYKPYFYHINEGRPAFAIWEIVSILMRDKDLSFEKAWEQARQSIIYTNHTLVAAGNLTYTEDAVKKWCYPFAKKLGVDANLLIKDGSIGPGTFSTTLFGLNTSFRQSAVSKVHAKYAKAAWPAYDWIPITNGVHFPRWQDSDFRSLQLTDRKIWELHAAKKVELRDTVIKRTGLGYDTSRLIITWARRLAEYKQPKVIFQDLNRLKEILSNSEKPVQLLFAGNSHSWDPNAKSIIEDIIKNFSTNLTGHAIFVPNYNISLANHLVSGSDVWLNTPSGDREACGTSGMKALANGVLSCTVIDGWTHEASWDDIGWVLNPGNISGSFYQLLQDEIVPAFYNVSQEGLPLKWIAKMKSSIALAKNFSAEKMFADYQDKLYGLK